MLPFTIGEADLFIETGALFRLLSELMVVKSTDVS